MGGRKGESISVHAVRQGGADSIATREVNKIIGKYTEAELSGVYMESRTVDGDKFIIVHLPNETLLCNTTVGINKGFDNAWTFVKSGHDSPWRGKFGVFDPRNGLWIYGDTQDSKLGYLDDKSFAQYDEAQEGLFYTPILPLKQKSVTQIDIDTIQGFSSTDVTVAFAMSYDGVTWGREYWSAVSVPDNYNNNYIIRRLGYVSQYFSMRFRFISKDKLAFSGVTPSVA